MAAACDHSTGQSDLGRQDEWRSFEIVLSSTCTGGKPCVYSWKCEREPFSLTVTKEGVKSTPSVTGEARAEIVALVGAADFLGAMRSGFACPSGDGWSIHMGERFIVTTGQGTFEQDVTTCVYGPGEQVANLARPVHVKLSGY